jgi:hypothetical protein
VRDRPLALTVVILVTLVILICTLWPVEPTGPIGSDQVLCLVCGRAIVWMDKNGRVKD